RTTKHKSHGRTRVDTRLCVSACMRPTILWLAIALVSGCATNPRQATFADLPLSGDSQADDAERERLIVQGDRFPVRIGLGPNPPVVVKVTVDQEGCIELPEIGRLRVAGMNASQMEDAAKAQYRSRGIRLHGMEHPGVVE